MSHGPSRVPLAWALVACATLSTGCTTQRETVVPVIDVASVHLAFDPNGPWQERSVEPEPAAPPRGATRGSSDAPSSSAAARTHTAPTRSASAEAPLRQPSPGLPVPAARGLGVVAPAGARPAKSLEQEARERFLDHPTEIVAESITLYAPPAILAEARLTAATLSQPGPGKRLGVGAARLALRELTLKAERISLRERAGTPDVQIMARGSVQFVSRRRDAVVREHDLQSLILTNDQMTPLR